MPTREEALEWFVTSKPVLEVKLSADGIGAASQLLCPVCGDTYTHQGDPVQPCSASPKGIYVNGDCLVIPMGCERGCSFALCVGQHKGGTFVWAVGDPFPARPRKPRHGEKGFDLASAIELGVAQTAEGFFVESLAVVRTKTGAVLVGDVFSNPGKINEGVGVWELSGCSLTNFFCDLVQP